MLWAGWDRSDFVFRALFQCSEVMKCKIKGHLSEPPASTTALLYSYSFVVLSFKIYLTF